MISEADILKTSAKHLRELGATLKIYGCPIAVVDLDRMAAGGTQDRKDDLVRLTSSQLTDIQIFIRLLVQFCEGAKGGKYPKGQAIELMGRTVGAPVREKLVGTPIGQGPKAIAGLARVTGGASFKHAAGGTGERVFGDVIGKVMKQHADEVKSGKLPLTAFIPHSLELERATKNMDAVMVQRVVRDTLRSSPVTATMGMDGLRLLSPVADAVEHALALVFFDALLAVVKGAKLGDPCLHEERDAALKPCAPNDEGSTAINERLRSAAASSMGVDLASTGGFASALYRRVMLLPSSCAQAAAIVQLGATLEQMGSALPPMFQKAAPLAQKGEWPALKPDEIVQTADRIFDPKQKAKDCLPGGLNPGRSPAKMILTLRGDWVARTQMVALAESAMREASPVDAPGRANLKLLYDFLNALTVEQRTEMMKGLYQMAQGDPDQRTRQIGKYFLLEAANVLKPGLTLGPLRVAFAKYWRAVESNP